MPSRRFIALASTPIICLALLSTLLAAAGFSARPLPISAQPPPTSSLLIRNGIIIDGTGAKRRRADIRIVGQYIAEVGSRLSVRPGGERFIDAKGKVVAPGFIDTHSHADGGIFENPNAETQIRQGITTAVVGQDGGSKLPLSEFFAALTKTPAALNFASFVGHGTVRNKVMGKDFKRRATPDEVRRMRYLVEREMRAGALGLSSGLEYDPGLYAATEEVIECAKAAAGHGGLYISHVRDEENEAVESFEELIRIAREARLPAQISHIKLGSSPVWGKAGNVLRRMGDARRRGLDITADVYPYTYWQSSITVIIPTRNWDDRAAWKKGLAEIGGPKNVLLTSYTPDAAWKGKTIAQIASMTGKDAISVIQEIVRKTHGAGSEDEDEGVVVTAMQETDLRRFIAAPRVMFCSDGGLRSSHPRGAGTYPRILGRYVREQKVIPLEEAVRKMTSLPARRMGFSRRGIIKPGFAADLVIFDPATVRDTATTASPTAPPVGISHVLVSGTPVLEGGKVTGAHPGKVLRRETKAGK